MRTVQASGALLGTGGRAVVSRLLPLLTLLFLLLPQLAAAQTLTVSIGDASVVEGDSGEIEILFSVFTSGGTGTVTIWWETHDLTSGDRATAGEDYVAEDNGRLSFRLGGAVRVKVKGDTKFEPDERFGVRITSATSASGVRIGDRSAIGTITNDDLLGLSIDDPSVDEGDSGSTTLEFPVTLDPAATGEVTVDWATADGTAQAGQDYTARNGSLTFDTGDSTKTLSVPVTGDIVDEPDETFTVTLSNASGAIIGDATGEGTIRDDDDTPTVTLELDTASVGENGGVSTVTAYLDHPSSEDTTVTVSASAVSPAVSGDYRLSANRELTIPAGQTTSTGTVTITAVNNSVYEGDKTVTVSARAANSQGVTGPDSLVLTIRDDDAPRVTLELDPSSIGEAGGVSTVTARLDRPSGEDTTVTVSASAVSPAVSGDYRLGANRELTIPAGQTASSGTVTIAAVDNTTDAPDKTVTVSATAANSQGVTGPDSLALTIRDDDDTPAVTLELGPSSISEDGGVSTVTARLDHPSSEDTTVTVSAAAVPPAAAGDYALSGTVLTIAAGETTSTGEVTITAVDNDVVAADKMVTVSGAATNAQGITGPQAVTLAIRNDDVPGLSVVDASVAEGDTGSATVRFTVRLNPAASVPVTVDWATADGTATAGTDYTPGSGSLRFDIGEDSKTVSVTVTGDNVDEPDETFTVTLSNASGTTIVDATGTGTIRDDDEPPTITLHLSPDTVTEDGGESTVTARLDRPSSEATTVTVSPAAAGDYTLGASRELTIPAGTTTSTGEVTIAAVNDAVDAPDKEVAVSATAMNSLGVTGPDSVVLTIRDDDLPVVTVAADAPAVTEGEAVAFTLTRTEGNLSEPLEVSIAFGDASSVLVPGAPSRVSFGVGSATVPLSPGTDDDDADEADATLTLTLQDGADYSLGSSGSRVATVTVRDNDLPVVTVAADAATVVEGTAAAFTLTRAGILSEALTVTGEFGIAPMVSTETLTATFERGDSTARMSGRPASDVGADTTYTLMLQPGAGYDLGAPSRATVTVRDDDATPSVSIADAEPVAEGDTFAFPVTLSGPFHAPVTVNWRVSGGSAVAADYTGAVDGAVTFAPWATQRTIRLATASDGAAEPEETVEVTLSLSAPDSGLATLGRSSATGRILDHEGPPVVTVAADAPAVTEGEAAAFTLTREGDLSVPLEVSVAFGDASSVLVPGAPSRVSFGVGAATVPLSPDTDDDDADEADATLTLTLRDGADYSLGGSGSHVATVTVRDDDLPVVTVAADAPAVTEGEAAAFTLTREGDLSVPLEVSVTFGDASSVLVPGAPSRVIFGAGSATVPLSPGTDDDDADEVDAMLMVTLRGVAGYRLGNPSFATMTVRDDDLPVVTVAADAPAVTEGEAAAFTLTRAGILSEALTVPVAVTAGDAVLASMAPTSVTFEADDATAALSLATDDDDADEADTPVTLTLQSGAGHDRGVPSAATVTVRDNDLPVITIAPASARIVDGEPVRFTLTRAGDLSVPLTVTTLFGTSPGTLNDRGQASFEAGASTAQGGGQPAPEADADITYYMGLEESAGYRRGEPSLAMVTALDDEATPVVSVADAGAVPEGGTLAFAVTLSRPFHARIQVAWTLGGTARAGDDHDGSASGTVTFAAGDTERTIRLVTQDDDVDEAEETVSVTLTDGNDHDLGTSAVATGRILDNDGPSQVTVAAVAASVTEGTAAEFILTRAGDLSGTPVVSFTVEDADGVLALAPPTGVPFVADSSTARVTLATVDDRVDEADATLTLTLHDGTGYGLGEQAVAMVTVRDNDATPTVSVADAGSVTEGGTLDYVVRLSHPSATDIPVSYTLGGTAVAGDYTDAAGGTVTFVAGDTERTIRLVTEDDDIDEAEETVEVSLAPPAADLATPGTPSTATGRILDNDLPVVTVAAVAAYVVEGTDAVFTLTRAGDLSVPLKVSFTVEDADGALAPPVPGGSVTFGAASATARVTLASGTDLIDKADASVVLTLQPDATAWRTGDPSVATVTVQDDDPAVVTIVADSSAVVEGTEATFTLTRTEGNLSEPLEVSFTIGDESRRVLPTAPATATFHVAAGTVTTLRLGTRDDTAAGADATVTVTLDDGTGYVLGDPSRATITVRDDDAMPTVSVAGAGAVPEGGTLVFPVTLSGPFHARVPVVYTLGGSATAGDDHDGSPSGTVIFVAGDTERTIRLVTVDDDADEEDETVTVTLAPDPFLATPGTVLATGTIQDDDLPVVTAEAASATVTEGADAVFTLTRAGDLTDELAVPVEVTGGGAVLTAAAPSRVTFPASAPAVTLRLGTDDDDADETDATVTLTLLPDAGHAEGDPSQATVTVEDDDLPVVTVEAASATVTEGADAVFTLTRAGVLTDELTVPVVVTDADGVVTTTPLPAGVTFPASAPAVTLRLGTDDDDADEADATVTVTLQSGAGHDLGDAARAAVTVRDDEPGVVSVAGAAAVTEGETLAFPVTLSAPSAAAIAVAYVVSGVDQAVAGQDFADVGFGLVTFAPGEVQKTISVATLDDDDIIDSEEGVRITLSVPDPRIATLGNAVAEGRILNDDLPVVTIMAEADTVTEGADAVFILTRTGDLSGELTVSVRIGSAPDTFDTTHTATFAVDQSTTRVSETIDGMSDVTRYAALQPGADHRLGDPSQATVTVRDDDATPTVSVADADAVPEGGTLEFPVSLSGPYNAPVTVAYTLSSDTATAGEDYDDAGGGAVTFDAGTTERTIRVGTVGDATEGPEETVVVTLADGDDHDLGTPATARGRILDDDATPAVSVADAGPVTEGGTLEFAVSLSGPYNAPVAVAWTLGGTATAGDDHDGPASGTVTFAPGDTSKVVSLVTVDDDADEEDETVTVTLTAPDPGLATLGSAMATGTIRDGDLPVVTVEAASATVLEGTDAEFTLTRAGLVSDELAVSFTVGDPGRALASAAPTGVTFGAGAATATVRLDTRNDTVDGADAAVTLTLRAGAGYDLGESPRATVTVRDDDLPEVSIADAGSVTEGGTLEFAVTLSTRSDVPIKVGYRFGGTAVPGGDHAGVLVGSVTFAPGATERTIRTVTVDDAVGEPEERVLVTLAPPDPRLATLGRSVATGRIQDDDLPVVTVAAAADAVTEGADVVFALTRTGAVSEALVVTVAVTDTAGVLVSAPPRNVTLAPGAATRMLRLGTRSDAVGAPDATVTLTLGSGSTYAGGDPSEATVTVRDDDLPSVTVATASGAVMEGEAAVFTVTRTGEDRSATLTVSIEVRDADGVLTTTPLPASVTVGVGDAAATLRLDTREDAVGDIDAVVTVTLRAGAGYGLGESSRAAVTVRDDDLPEVSIADADPVTEGGTLEFAVTLSHPNAAAIPVVYGLGGTAEAGSDHTGGAGGTLVFAPGEMRKTVSVATVDDSTLESGETVEVDLLVGSPGLPGPSTEATGHIRDNERPVVTVEAVHDSIMQGEDVQFVFRRTGDASRRLTARYRVTTNNALLVAPLGNDGDGMGAVDFAVGQDTVLLRRPTSISDEDYPVTLSLLPSAEDGHEQGARRGYAQGRPRLSTITARVAGGVPRVFIGDAPTVTEGGTLEFPVTLDLPWDQTIDLRPPSMGSHPYARWGTGGGTATGGSIGADIVTPPSWDVNFAPGERHGVVSYQTIDDARVEREETVELRLRFEGNSPVTLGSGRAVGRIRDNDEPVTDAPVVTVAAGSPRIAEGEEAAFTLTRTGDLSRPLTVGALLTDGTQSSPVATPVDVRFQAGDATAALRRGTLDDAVAEADTTVLLVLRDGADHDLGDPFRAAVTVRDDDRQPEVSIADAPAVTEGGTLAFPVRLSVPGAEAITVGYALAGTAAEGVDYADSASGIVTFAPGVMARTIRLVTLDDGADEPEETVRVSIVTVTTAGAVEIVGPGVKTAAGRILDDDLLSVEVAADAASVAEGEDAAFTLTRAGILSEFLAVSFAVGDPDGVLASNAPTGAIFQADEATARVVLATEDDATDEADATLTLALANGAGYVPGAVSVATVTVRDDDPWTVTVAADTATVTEGEDAAFTLTRAGRGDPAETLEVSFAVEDADGVLTSAAPTGVTFGSGASTARVVLVTEDDGAAEPDGALTLTLVAGATYHLDTPSAATVTVRDNDTRPELSIADAGTVREGGVLEFPVTLSQWPGRTVEVPFVLGGTARGPGQGGVLDYEFADSQTEGGELTFGPGVTERSIRLRTLDDGSGEDEETVEIAISLPGDVPNLGLGQATATGRIQDGVSSTVTVAAVADTAAEGTAAAFTLTRTGGDPSVPLTVSVQVTDTGSVLTAEAPSAVTFGAGVDTVTLRLDTSDDALDEPDAVLTLTLQAGDGYFRGRTTATVTVRDDDLPVVTVAPAADAAAEGTAAAFILTRTGILTERLVVPVRVTDAGAVLAGTPPSAVTFEVDASTAPLDLGTRDDELDGTDAAVTVALTDGAGYDLGEPSGATVTVRDNDGLPDVWIADAAPVTEGGTLAFPVTLSHPSDTQVTVDYRFSGGTAAAGSDFSEAAAGSVAFTATFAPGDTEETISLATVDDADDEAEETVEVRLTAPGPGLAPLGANSRATGRIRDNDGDSEVTVAPVADSVTEGGAAAFTLTRANGDLSGALDVAFTIEDADSVLAPGAPSSVTFAAGDATVTLRLGTLDDTADEPDATLTLTLRDGTGYSLGDAHVATVTVRDDELPVVTVAPVAGAVAEGGDAAFILTRVGDLSAALAVSVQVTDAGSALTDAPPSSVRFEAGAATATLRLGTDDDEGPGEADTTVTLTLVDGADYDLGTPSRATVTVRDDDEAPEVSIADAEPVAEGGTLVFPVTLSRPYDEAISVLYGFNVGANDTADKGADYDDAASQPQFTFAPGETEKAISLVTVDDGDHEGEETVSVTVTIAMSEFEGALTRSKATGRILDDDIPVVTVAADAAMVTEGADAVFTLTRAEGDRSVEVMVPVTVTDAGSVLAETPPASVSFAVDAATATLRLGTDDDATDEPDTVVTLTLADGDGHDLGTPSEAMVTVQDNDLPEVSIADAAPVPEGGTLEFTVSLSSPGDAAIPVDFTVMPGTAAAGDDYVIPASGTVAFAPGDTSKVISVVTLDDDADEADEMFEVTLTAPDPGLATLGASTATGTIEDDDLPIVTVAADVATVGEGGMVAFTLTRVGYLPVELTVSFEVTGGDAVLASPAPTEVTFQADSNTARVTLATEKDAVDEVDAEVTLTLRSGPAWELGTPSAATVTVLDNENPVVTVAAEDPPAITEGADVVFTLTRTRFLARELDVSVAVTGGDAVLAGAAPTVATFQAGDATATLRLGTDDDNVDDPEATVTLTLVDGHDYDLGDPSQAAVTVRDNDLPFVTVVAESEQIVEEGADLAFIIARTGGDLSEMLEVLVLFKQPGQEATEGSNTIQPGDSTHRAGGSPAQKSRSR